MNNIIYIIFFNMCFNETVSLATWLTGMTGSAMLLKLNKIPEAMFYGTTIQMQLIEYFLWKNQPNCDKKCQIPADNLCNQANKNITKAGTIINHLEPIALLGGIALFSKRQLPTFVIIYMIIFIIITFSYTYYIFDNTKNDDSLGCSIVTEKSSPHLHWKWNDLKYKKIYYSLFLAALLLLSFYGLEDGKFQSALILISYIVSYFIYGNTKSTGAMWCFMAAFAPWLLTIYFIIKKK